MLSGRACIFYETYHNTVLFKSSIYNRSKFRNRNTSVQIDMYFILFIPKIYIALLKYIITKRLIYRSHIIMLIKLE